MVYLQLMMLEDHLGDILYKARQIAGVSLEQAALAGGVSVQDLQLLETTGAMRQAVAWSQLARTIGLNPPKLERLAQDWQPKSIDLARWRQLRRMATTQSGNTVNAYLIWDETTREAALFDTGWEAASIVKRLREHKLTLRHIFITHAHEDHVAALAELRQAAPEVKLHASSSGFRPEERNRPQDCIALGNLRITHRNAPGHAEDSVVYVIGNFPDNAPLVAVVGDCLFAGSIGRGFQSPGLLKKSIVEQIFSLPGDTLLGPGHGPLTTVSEQKEINPFF
jgi:hydroxyacylglutathione hydrolase